MVDAWYDDGRVRVFHGDCLDVLRAMPDCSVDAVVTDPPAAIGFMGRSWDSDRGGRDQWVGWLAERMAEALRVVKPGGHALVWALPRTSHWTALALEDAGWDIRDCIVHLFGSGFPKSLSVGPAIDKMLGAERKVVGSKLGMPGYSLAPGKGRSTLNSADDGSLNDSLAECAITVPATDAARQWEGFGTSLKPASETWWLCRKPLTGTVAANVLEWGTGALNIGACRVGTTVETWPSSRGPNRGTAMSGGVMASRDTGIVPPGRWPSNVVLSHVPLVDADGVVVGDACAGGCQPGCPVAELDAQSGDRLGHQSQNLISQKPKFVAGVNLSGSVAENRTRIEGYNDNGGASRFFATFRYEAKADTSERPKAGDTAHPTVKPLGLMQWLCRLVVPPGGTCLDMFAGSGTTGEACQAEGFPCILIEREADYLPLIEQRLTKRSDPVKHLESKGEDMGLFELL